MNSPERPGAEEAGLAESAHGEFLREILRQMPAAVLVVDAASGHTTFANRQAEALFDRSIPLGEPPPLEGFHSDGRPYTGSEWPFGRALRDGTAVEVDEIEIPRPAGGRAVVRMSAAPLRDESGEVVAAIAACFDVSEQRRRYAARRFLADASSLLGSSLDYVTTLRNLARLAVPTLADWCTIDAVTEQGTIERVAVEHSDRRKARVAADLARRYPPDPQAQAGVAKAIRTGQAELVAEVTPEVLHAVARSPQHLRLLEELGVRSAMFVPLITRGRTLGAISFVSAESGRVFSRDDLELGEELAARAALAMDNARLFQESRAATEAKSDFLAVMSHELRTPLTAIIGYAELLQLGVPDAVTPRQHEQAERIEVSARHLLQLIEEILTLVTLESGEIRLRDEEVDLDALLERAVAIVEPMARAKEIELRVSAPPGGVHLESDADKLLQVLLNLLSNAVKFTQTGEVRLSARAAADWVELEVRDTGIGLDPEHMPQIFEPFWQAEPPITRRASGTGLGLTISRRLADLLGGEIVVESELGKGSTFTLRVPYRSVLPAGDPGAGREGSSR